ncbi:MAG: replicative DNA helicase [Candidatus Eisenbacteria bacterium]|uniref:Replicative DNA helicase n=1 Tax=Eiseniibacteriota bacterium TaxID=2212470 RepID=A0A937XA51_UNCEI|nr:replicative DNA helicase [Candidatus Eisenbacteria bacterium]
MESAETTFDRSARRAEREGAGLPGKVPPQNLEAEQAVLASMLLDPAAIDRVEEILDEHAFYRGAHRRVFQAIAALSARNESVDLITVTEELRRRGDLEAIGGMTFLQSLLDSVSSAANVAHYARLVLEKAVLRRMISTAGEIIEKSYEAAKPWSTILDQAEQMLFTISQTRLKKEFLPIKDVLKTTFEIIEELYEHKRSVTGVESGFEDLDRLTAGFQKSDLIIIAGRPSMGKTSLMLNMAEHAAIKKRLPIGLFSLEMSKEQVVQRFLCSQARIPAQRLRTGFLKESEWPKLTDAAAHLSEAPIFIDDTPAIGLMEMRAKARRLKSRHGLGLLLVDYLQLAQGLGNAESRQQEISQISQGLKALAKELEIPVIAGSQLSRAVEARENKRPILSDLRESGAIEQDADLVMFVYREEVYKPEKEEVKGLAELIIGKHRNGPTDIVPLVFIGEFTRFEARARIGDDFMPGPRG